MLKTIQFSFGRVFYSEDWGSNNYPHRNLIRKDLYQKTGQEEMLNLDKRPHLEGYGISISHCKSLGGYLFSQDEHIGLDIEDGERLQKELVTRVAQPKELKLFDEKTLPFLWCIKEAGYKALRGEAALISEVEVLEFNYNNGRAHCQGIELYFENFKDKNRYIAVCRIKL